MEQPEVLSPRALAGICNMDEREEVGRFLRVTHPVRRGEAILVEDPLFLSPANRDELDTLLRQTLDSEAIPSNTAEVAECFPVSAQLSLVVAWELLADVKSQACEEFQQLDGDAERWRETASRLWQQMREELREQIALEAMCEICAIVATNAHAAEGGRAGIFSLGSYAEHSCTPSAFKEVLVPAEGTLRPGSPCCSASSGVKLPPSCPRVNQGAPDQPQLVVRALRDLAVGENVSLSYIPEYLPTWRRRELLQAGYGFLCSCDRCMREPEMVCAYVCPNCDNGPCSPTHPIPVLGQLKEYSLRCEDCGIMIEGESELEAMIQAELAEVVTPESTSVLHPFHHKIFGMYLHNLQAVPALQRIQAISQLMEAQRRLCCSRSHPLLGRLCELMASAQLEVNDAQQALASFKHAQELYSFSHKGSPDPGHDMRCYDMQVKINAGTAPLGAKPRRISKIMSRSPSLPSLAENDSEYVSA